MDPEKIGEFYRKMIDAAEECGLTIITERMYLIDLATGAATTMSVMPAGKQPEQKRQ